MRGSPFFDGVQQMPIEIAGEPVKFPVFYYDASSMNAIFPARYGELRKLLPNARFVPARLAPGLGAVAVTCLEYRDTDAGAYNEVAISIPLNEPAFRANLPGRALWKSARRGQLDVFVHHLPVTTDVALRGGVDYYNFPKFLAGIEFEDDSDSRSCRLAEGQEHILTLTGRKLPAPGRAEVQNSCHLWMDGQPQRAELKVNQLEVGTSLRPGAATLELGARHPIAHELDRVLISRRSLQYEYVPRFEAILYGPEHLTLPLIRQVLAANAEAERSIAAS
jgi:hypothetical protein